MQSLTIPRPDDWHLHLRDGAMLKTTVPASATVFHRTVVMPNLVPPVTTVTAALEYRARIMEEVPEGVSFNPLMALYLTAETTPEQVAEAAANDHIIGFKLYPSGATTNSAAGVKSVEALEPVLAAMQEHGLPLLVHGGPGRAGGGEEMGGLRGIRHYMQRTAIQGHPSMLTAITEQYQPGSVQPESVPHVFRKHFEELNVGDTVTTAKHTVTESDITNFANVSGDNFYAHVDETSLEDTIFEQRVAHGYFILSKAAGLFVEPKKGPVLLNYGIEECRFTKPVYPGATIGVRLTVKEKISQERREPEDIAKGIVKYLVDVYDETGETVAIATILTMVKCLDQTPD